MSGASNFEKAPTARKKVRNVAPRAQRHGHNTQHAQHTTTSQHAQRTTTHHAHQHACCMPHATCSTCRMSERMPHATLQHDACLSHARTHARTHAACPEHMPHVACRAPQLRTTHWVTSTRICGIICCRVVPLRENLARQLRQIDAAQLVRLREVLDMMQEKVDGI